ncbi:GNAT family N-acetyltransferase [Cysteiniphilum sp. JM-1]|uniref:GNAT family N-acetyltransferase n=1 Tax=Cysteiniphilum TaxID=2056696 RepID=UPI00124762DB|nr:GNAT family protein [Cysteiniphilum sp. JM-1]
MLHGKKVRLRYYEPEDFSLVHKLRNLPESYDYFYEYEPINSYMTKSWWESSFTRKNEKNFIIANIQTNEAIGTCALVDIDFRNGTCEFGRLYVDESKSFLGASVEAELLCLEYAFYHMNIRKICLEIFSDNKQVISLHKQFGFEKEAERKAHVYKNGEYKDISIYSMFKADFINMQEKIKNKLDRMQ